MKELEPGIRVTVKSGDGVTDLGEGTYLGTATVYAWFDEVDGLYSQMNAEEPPKDVRPGVYVITAPNNPKIKLDSGRIVYGCQVWWKPIS